MGWFSNIQGVFNSAGKTKPMLVLSTVRLWGLRIPMIYFFYYFTNLGPTGIWLAMVISNAITCIVGEVLYRKEMWYR